MTGADGPDRADSKTYSSNCLPRNEFARNSYAIGASAFGADSTRPKNSPEMRWSGSAMPPTAAVTNLSAIPKDVLRG
jgi:hypothetical protein